MEVPQGNQGDTEVQGGAQNRLEVPQGNQGDTEVQGGAQNRLEVPQGNQGDTEVQGGAQNRLEVPQGNQGNEEVQRGTANCMQLLEKDADVRQPFRQGWKWSRIFPGGISGQSKLGLLEKKKSWKGSQQILQ